MFIAEIESIFLTKKYGLNFLAGSRSSGQLWRRLRSACTGNIVPTSGSSSRRLFALLTSMRHSKLSPSSLRRRRRFWATAGLLSVVVTGTSCEKKSWLRLYVYSEALQKKTTFVLMRGEWIFEGKINKPESAADGGRFLFEGLGIRMARQTVKTTTNQNKIKAKIEGMIYPGFEL